MPLNDGTMRPTDKFVYGPHSTGSHAPLLFGNCWRCGLPAGGIDRSRPSSGESTRMYSTIPT